MVQRGEDVASLLVDVGRKANVDGPIRPMHRWVVSYTIDTSSDSTRKRGKALALKAKSV